MLQICLKFYLQVDLAQISPHVKFQLFCLCTSWVAGLSKWQKSWFSIFWEVSFLYVFLWKIKILDPSKNQLNHEKIFFELKNASSEPKTTLETPFNCPRWKLSKKPLFHKNVFSSLGGLRPPKSRKVRILNKVPQTCKNIELHQTKPVWALWKQFWRKTIFTILCWSL